MAAPLKRLRRWAELERVTLREVESVRLGHRLAWLHASARRRQGQDVERALIELFDATHITDPPVAAEVAVELTHLHLSSGLEAARAWAKRALLLFSELGDRVRAAKSLCEIAMVDRMQGLVTRAAERFDEARAVLEAEADERDVLNVLTNAWPVIADLGHRHEAHDLADRAMTLAEVVGDPGVCLHAGANHAAMLAESGYLGRAVAEAVRSLGRWREGYEQLAVWLQGTAAYWSGLLGEADQEAEIQACVVQFGELGFPRLAGFLELKRLDLARRARGDRGLDELDRIDAMFAAEGDLRGQAEAALERGWRTRSLEDAQTAMPAAQRQSVLLTCDALLLLATVQGAEGHAAFFETIEAGLRLASRTEHLLHVARLERLAAGVDGSAARVARAESLLRDLALPASAPAVR